jgi:hypothetical protein
MQNVPVSDTENAVCDQNNSGFLEDNSEEGCGGDEEVEWEINTLNKMFGVF